MTTTRPLAMRTIPALLATAWLVPVGLLLVTAVSAAGQEPPAEAMPSAEAPRSPNPPPTPPPRTAGLYVGPVSCAQDSCHGATRPRRVFGVAQNEFYVWLHQGPHAKAVERLFDDRSKAIAANLGLAAPPSESAACLSCHATAPPEGRRAGPIDVLDGVSCESCHGPASGWRDGHTAEDWSHRDSVAAGMVDLRDVATRTTVCLGCHLGRPGRVVDHDLIAAGHPALRFEVDNFSQFMPPHWLPDADRPAASRPPRPTHGVRAWATGQAVSLQRSAEELARRARGDGADTHWPDFSWMSCGSCHRTLPAGTAESAGSGQPGVPAPEDRTYRARIGLPPWSPGRWVVLRVLVERHAPDALAALDQQVATLARQVSRITTPGPQVAASAEALARTLDGVAQRLDTVEWNEAEIRHTLQSLAAQRSRLAEVAGADARSAEQVVMAVYSLAGALIELDERALDQTLVESLLSLERALVEDRPVDLTRFRDLMARIENEVR